ncbi:hypothetical protein [Acinetobacter chinensis]|uniref:hypothetical protein n=1 Tax=Acinetobacter chinensis TaxID=2004650 RepID=UPI002934ADC0|nr:hypothetical protein [Acinetobacter chinensis]WOE40698.1 hypothetical protein QSG87_12495 [Acinetobacter chinensis]
MNKSVKYFTEGLFAAFVLAPRVPVQPVKPVEIERNTVIGNAAKHWESVGLRMTEGTKTISLELSDSQTKLNSII